MLSIKFSPFGSGCLELRNYFTSLFQENPKGCCPRCAQDLPLTGVPKWKADLFERDAFRRPHQILSRGRKRKWTNIFQQSKPQVRPERGLSRLLKKLFKRKMGMQPVKISVVLVAGGDIEAFPFPSLGLMDQNTGLKKLMRNPQWVFTHQTRFLQTPTCSCR